MRFEQIQEPEGMINSLFHNRDDFRRAVQAALEQSKKGGYRPGTPTFTKMIIGVGQKLNPREYRIAQREIADEIKLIESEAESNGEGALRENKTITNGAKEQEAREAYRDEFGKYPEE